MSNYRLGSDEPRIAADAFVAPGTHLIGQIELGARVNIWFGAVLRGDNEPIVIGAESNVQEGAVLHADPGFPLTIGARRHHRPPGDAARLHDRRRLADRHPGGRA